MNIVTIKLADISRRTIPIGYEGEQNHTRVIFYCAEIFDNYPDAVPTMVIKGSGDAYPQSVTKDDSTIIWDVTPANVYGAGSGTYQFTFTQGEEVIKSIIGSFSVNSSIVGNGEAPDPVTDWVNEANAVLADLPNTINESIDDALEEAKASGDFKGDPGDPGAKGDKGDPGDPAPASAVAEAVDDYLEENFSNPSNPPLDRSLTSALSAAPADLVGDLKNEIDGIPDIGKISENATLNLFDGTITNFASSSGKVVTDPAYRSYVWPVSNGDSFVTSRKSTSVCNRFRVFYTTEYPAVGVTTYKEDGTAGTPNQYAGDSDRTKAHTVPSSQTFKYAVLFLSNNSETINDSCEIMINTGNKEQMWEKYRLTAVDTKARTAAGKLEDAADGMVTGYDNLFTGETVKLGWSNGVIVSNANYRSFYWRVSKGETYTISRRNKTDFSMFRIAFTTEEPAPYVLVYTTAGNQESPGSTGDSYRTYSFTVPTNLNYKYAMLEMSSSGQTIDDTCELMINRGAEEHPWVKYRYTAIDLEAREAEEEVTLRHMRYPWNKVSTPVPNLTLLHFTDIHGDAVNLASIAAFRAKYSSLIDDAICTGDMVLQKYGTGAYTLMDAMPDTLQVIGNHDTYNGSDWFDLDESDTYDKYFSDYVDGWNAETTSGKCYYYKDYAAIGIRLIVLDNMHESAEQLSWFETALAGAKTAGYTVVCADHIAYTGLTSLQTDFDTEYMTHRFDTNRTHAYENRSEDYPDAVDDFIEGGGKFACWLTGHVHASMFAQLTNHPGQIMVSAPNAGISGGTTTRESERISGTPTQDAFNIVAIDPTLSLVKVMRIGCRRTIWGKHPTMTVWDYANQQFTSGEPDGGIEVDDALDASSENPVQNKVIYAAIGDIETLLAAL